MENPYTYINALLLNFSSYFKNSYTNTHSHADTNKYIQRIVLAAVLYMYATENGSISINDVHTLRFSSPSHTYGRRFKFIFRIGNAYQASTITYNCILLAFHFLLVFSFVFAWKMCILCLKCACHTFNSLKKMKRDGKIGSEIDTGQNKRRKKENICPSQLFRCIACLEPIWTHNVCIYSVTKSLFFTATAK